MYTFSSLLGLWLKGASYPTSLNLIFLSYERSSDVWAQSCGDKSAKVLAGSRAPCRLDPSSLAMVLTWMVYPMKSWMGSRQKNNSNSGHLLSD